MSLKRSEIDRFMFSNSAVNRYYLGTFAACDIQLVNQKRYCFITNTDDHVNPGQHWNSWFVKDGKLLFMDSFGRAPTHPEFPSYYKEYVKQFYEYEYCTIPIQSATSTNCGLYCIHFIYLLSYGLDFEHFLKQYYLDLNQNDNVVVKFYNSFK